MPDNNDTRHGLPNAMQAEEPLLPVRTGVRPRLGGGLDAEFFSGLRAALRRAFRGFRDRIAVPARILRPARPERQRDRFRAHGRYRREADVGTFAWKLGRLDRRDTRPRRLGRLRRAVRASLSRRSQRLAAALDMHGSLCRHHPVGRLVRRFGPRRQREGTRLRLWLGPRRRLGRFHRRNLGIRRPGGSLRHGEHHSGPRPSFSCS